MRIPLFLLDKGCWGRSYCFHEGWPPTPPLGTWIGRQHPAPLGHNCTVLEYVLGSLLSVKIAQGEREERSLLDQKISSTICPSVICWYWWSKKSSVLLATAWWCAPSCVIIRYRISGTEVTVGRDSKQGNITASTDIFILTLSPIPVPAHDRQL